MHIHEFNICYAVHTDRQTDRQTDRTLIERITWRKALRVNEKKMYDAAREHQTEEDMREGRAERQVEIQTERNRQMEREIDRGRQREII